MINPVGEKAIWVANSVFTFDDARRVVQAGDDHRPVDAEGTPYPVARRGLENDEVFVVPFDYGQDVPHIDEPTRLVDKRSGRLMFGSPGALPPGLRPVS
jgi:hypothetical protein